MQGPPVLLSYYVARVICCGPGALSSLSPFLGCLSGSSELAWGFLEPLRTFELRCSASGCALHPSLCLGWAAWVIPCCVFSWLSLLERGCGVLCFRHRFCGEDSGPLPCSSVCGLHCTGPTNARQSQWETVISCAGGQVLPGQLRLRIVSGESGSLLPQGVTGRIEDRCLLLAPDAVVTGVLSLGHGTVCFVSFELCSLVLPLRLFFVKNFAVILVEARECGSCALPCEATWEQLLLGSSQPSTGSVW